MAASSTIIPQLCDALEAAQKEIERLKMQCDINATSFFDMRNMQKEATARAEKAEAENRWIPVSERMPKDPGWYQVFRKGHSHAEDGYFRGKTWSFGKHYGEVTHWRPLPEPPKGE